MISYHLNIFFQFVLSSGHPNVVLFITHGGLFSITEATYHGVPILGLPVFGDQESNMLYAVSDGIGESIEWDELTEELLKTKLNSLLNERKYVGHLHF